MDIISYSKAKKAETKANSVQAQLDQFTKVVLSVGDPANPQEGVLYAVIPEQDMPVTDYFFRFDAMELGIENGSSVTEWSDLSGNGNHVYQSDSSLQPVYLAEGLNGRPTVRFEGTYLESGLFQLDNTDAFTVFVVTNTDARESSARIMSIGENDQSSSEAYYISFSGGRQSVGSVLPGGERYGTAIDGNPRLYTANYNGAENSIYVNGASSGSISVTGDLGAHNSLGVGRRVTSSSSTSGILPYYGEISEIIYFSRDLNASEMSALNTYLMDKWGI